jgi:hypothetical protein
MSYRSNFGADITVGGVLTVTAGSYNTWDGSTSYALTITGTTTIAGTLNTRASTVDMNGTLATSSGTLVATTGTFTFSGATWNTPTTFTHSSGKVTFDLTGTSTLGNASTQFSAVTVSDGTTLDTSTYNITLAGNLIVGGGTSGLLTTTASSTITLNGTTTIASGATLGTAATAYTLDMNGNLLTSAGTLINTTGALQFTFAGAVWNTPTTFTHSNGYVYFDGAGTTTLGNNSTQFYSIYINGPTFDTDSTGNYNLTCAHTFTMWTAVNFNASTVSLGSGMTTQAVTINNGTLTGGSGPHTYGNITLQTMAGSTWSMSTGGTTIDGYVGVSADYASVNKTAGTITHNSSLLTLTNTTAGGFVSSNVGMTFYHLTINGPGATFTESLQAALTVAGNLILTAGTLYAINVGIDVTGTTSVTGTMTLWTNKSFNLTGTTTVNNGGILGTTARSYSMTAGNVIATGTVQGGTGSVSMQSLTISASTGVYTAAGVKTTITGKNASSDAWVNSNTFTHNSGKVDFTGTGASYHIHGDNQWYDLEVSLATASTYLFENGKTQTINNSTVLTGTAGNILTINSVSGSATWLYTIVAGKSQTHDYIDVSYSDASGGDTATQTNSTESGDNNVNWSFVGPTVTLSAASDDAWSTDAAWSSSAEPIAGDNVVFDVTSTYNCIVDVATAAIDSITVDSAYTGTITISNTITVAGDVTIDFGGSGTFAGSEGITITDTSTLNNSDPNLGKVNVNASGKTVSLGESFQGINIIVTAGKLDATTSNFDIYITGLCTVNGTLDLRADSTTISGNVTIGAGGLLDASDGSCGINILGNLNPSAGELSAPAGSYNFGFAGLTWNTPTTFTNNNGTVVFISTTTLGNDSNDFYQVQIGTTTPSSTFSLNTNGYDLTTENSLHLIANTSESRTATLTCGASAITAGSGVVHTGATYMMWIDGPGTTFNGGSGTHLYGDFYSNEGVTTLSSGTTTIDTSTSDYSIAFAINAGTFSSTTANLEFTYAGDQLLYDQTNTARTFNDLTVNNASCVLEYYTGKGFVMNLGGDINITDGTFYPTDVGGTGFNLTVTGDAIVDGTLGTAASYSASFRSMTISATGTYIQPYQGTTITGRDGSDIAWSNSGTFTTGSNRVYFTGEEVTGNYDILGSNVWPGLQIVLGALAHYRFEEGKTQEIANDVTINGPSSAQRLYINSVSGAADWKLVIDSSQNFRYIDVHHSDATGSVSEANGMDHCTDGGNNTFWLFPTIQYWVAPADGVWSDSGNWTSRVPLSFDSVVFDNSSVKNCDLDTDTNSLDTFTVASNYSGTIDLAGYYMTVTGAATIAGIIVPSTGTLDMYGTTTIQSGGNVGENGSWTFYPGDDFVIEAGGTFSAPDSGGDLEMIGGDLFTPAGTYTANGGAFLFENSTTVYLGANWIGAYNFSVHSGTTIDTGSNYAITVEGTATIDSGGVANLNDSVITLGTASASGTWDNDGTTNLGSTTFQGADAAYFGQLTGSDVDWDYGAPSAVVIKLMNIVPDATTGGGGVVVGFDTQATNNAWTITDNDTIDCGTADVTFAGTGASNYSLDVGGTFNGVSGDDIIGSIHMLGTSDVTFSSGNTTINDVSAVTGISICWEHAATYDDGNGTVTFTYAGTQLLSDEDVSNKTFYNLVVNNASCVVQGRGAHGPPVTVANDLTITDGTYDTREAGGGASRAFTVTKDAIVSGTLTGNSSVIRLGSMEITATGTYTATSGTTTITGRNASDVAWSNSNVFTPSNGKVDFTGQTGTGTYDIEGDNIWYKLEISLTAACTYRFENGKTQEIVNAITITGTLGNLVTLNSTTGSSTWLLKIDGGATQSFTQIVVTYSDASSGIAANGKNQCTNAGNNFNWLWGGTVASGGTVGKMMEMYS